MNWQQLVINNKSSIYDALHQINSVGFSDGILFVVNDEGNLIGTLTDGDIRRGLLKKFQTTDMVEKIAFKEYLKIIENETLANETKNQCIENEIEYLPIVNSDGKLIDVVSYREIINKIPVQAIIMAGGRGERLKPLTDHTPKPMLVVGNKPIIEHNIDRLIKAGVKKIAISISYLGEVLVNHFGNGESKKIEIEYITEDKPLGTLGAVSNYENWIEDDILVMNSDLLTNIDFEDFYKTFKKENADIAVATIPYKVDLPYAVMEIVDNKITSLVEKPTYTYYANAGIYLVKKKHLQNLPKNTFYNTTDLIENLSKNNYKGISVPILGYWLDIGKKHDFEKAQEDIKHLKL